MRKVTTTALDFLTTNRTCDDASKKEYCVPAELRAAGHYNKPHFKNFMIQRLIPSDREHKSFRYRHTA